MGNGDFREFLHVERPVLATGKRLRLPCPRGIHVVNSGDVLKLTRNWLSANLVVLAILCVAWNSFLAFWYSEVVAVAPPLLLVNIPVVHVAIGIGLAYFALAGFLNRTVISIDHQQVFVQHGPIPWPGKIRMPTENIQEIIVAQHSTKNGRPTYAFAFDVNALMKSGQIVSLLKNLDARDQALYIQQIIEQHLRLGIDSEIGHKKDAGDDQPRRGRHAARGV
jgi:hypothetical protein